MSGTFIVYYYKPHKTKDEIRSEFKKICQCFKSYYVWVATFPQNNVHMLQRQIIETTNCMYIRVCYYKVRKIRMTLFKDSLFCVRIWYYYSFILKNLNVVLFKIAMLYTEIKCNVICFLKKQFYFLCLILWNLWSLLLTDEAMKTRIRLVRIT